MSEREPKMAQTEEPQTTIGLGDVIGGRYRVECVLGTGGMAIVVAATQLDLERLVAVKVMRAELTAYPGAVQRLMLEAKLTARFRSEHICKVLDVGTLPNGAPYVVMEYLEGSDFCTLLAQGQRFEVSEAVDFMLQACEALAEAHAAEIVHRDLKPENIFVAKTLDGSSTIKVLDFGISKQVGVRAGGRSLTNPQAMLGSPNYMAPEQMDSSKPVDARVDLWAMGAILFEILTGKSAFEGETMPEVCRAVVDGDPKPIRELRPDVPEGLAHAIERCLRKKPDERFQHVLELATAIAPFASAAGAASLSRIERVLRGGTLPGLPPAPLSSKPPPSIMPSPKTRGPEGAREASSATQTTGGASVLVRSLHPARAPWPRLLLAGALIACGFIVWSVLRSGNPPADHESGDRRTAEPATVESEPGGMPASAPHAMTTAAAAAEPALQATVSAPEPSSSAHVAPSAAPKPSAAALQARPALPVRPAAPAQQSGPRKPLEAWDPASFGPRR